MPLFSKRLRMSEAAVEWCKEHGASPDSPFNIVTALLSLGLVVVLTDEEREAIEFKAAHCVTFADQMHQRCAVTLRALLERTK